MKSDIQQRLGALSIELDDQVMDRQLAAIEVALTAPPAPVTKPRRSWRYRLAPIAAGLTLFAAPAAAVAAESSVPGDLLYPMKQVTEQVRSWFDPGIVVEHRLEELETVLDRDAADDVVSDRLRAAERAVSDAAGTDQASQYRARLDAARDQARQNDTPQRSGEPAQDSVPEPGDANPDRPDDAPDPSPDRDRTRDPDPVTTTSTPTRDRGSSGQTGDEPPADGNGNEDGSGDGRQRDG